jgi:hypothetical protein
MIRIKRAFALVGLATLSGCVAVPVDPYPRYDYPPAGYYAPAPYHGASISLGIYGSRSSGSHYRDGHSHGKRAYRGWRRR